jgi:hypothetical protein
MPISTYSYKWLCRILAFNRARTGMKTAHCFRPSSQEKAGEINCCLNNMSQGLIQNAHRLSHRSRLKLLWVPGRSPDSRIIKPKLPSQRLGSSGMDCFDSPRLQWRGRAGFSPASQINQASKFCNADLPASQVFP